MCGLIGIVAAHDPGARADLSALAGKPIDPRFIASIHIQL